MKHATLCLCLCLCPSPRVAAASAVTKACYWSTVRAPPFNWSEGSEAKGGVAEVLKNAGEERKYNRKFTIFPLVRRLQILDGRDRPTV